MKALLEEGGDGGRGMRQGAAARGAVLVDSPRQDATQRAAQKLHVEAGSVPKVQGTYPELAQPRAACWGTIMVDSRAGY